MKHFVQKTKQTNMFDRIFEGSARVGAPMQFHFDLHNYAIDGLGPNLREIGISGPTIEVQCMIPVSERARGRGGSINITIILCRECGMVSSHMEGDRIRCPRCGNRARESRMRGAPGSVVRMDDPLSRQGSGAEAAHREWTSPLDQSKSKEEKEREEMKHEFEESFDKQWQELSEFENLPEEIEKIIRENSILLHCEVTEDILRGASPKEYDEIQQQEVAKIIKNQLSDNLALRMEQDYSPEKAQFKYTTEYVILLPRQIIKLLIKTFWAGYDYNENQNNEEDG